MWPFAFVFVAGCVAALAVGRTGGRALLTRVDAGASPRWLPGLVLLPALLPLAWHYQRNLELARGFGSSASPDLDTLALAVPFAVILFWLAASLVVRRLPLLALAFPILAVFLYVRLVLAQLLGPPRGMSVDIYGFTLLLGFEAVATCLTFGLLWGLLGLPGMLRRWPLAWR